MGGCWREERKKRKKRKKRKNRTGKKKKKTRTHMVSKGRRRRLWKKLWKKSTKNNRPLNNIWLRCVRFNNNSTRILNHIILDNETPNTSPDTTCHVVLPTRCFCSSRIRIATSDATIAQWQGILLVYLATEIHIERVRVIATPACAVDN